MKKTITMSVQYHPKFGAPSTLAQKLHLLILQRAEEEQPMEGKVQLGKLEGLVEDLELDGEEDEEEAYSQIRDAIEQLVGITVTETIEETTEEGKSLKTVQHFNPYKGFMIWNPSLSEGSEGDDVVEVRIDDRYLKQWKEILFP